MVSNPIDTNSVADASGSKINLSHDEQSMLASKALVEAFSDPRRVPLPLALQLIEMAVMNRPDANELRETLAVRFIKQNGITMYGSTIKDNTAGQTYDPDTNPGTLYVSPYDRPTAGAHTFVTYQDGNGEIYVAIVKNWKDRHDHSKGAEADWRFSGGYMNIGQDPDLETGAARELQEEINLKADPKHLPEILFVDSKKHAFDKTHSIVANCYLDLGRHTEAPPVLAGDDVATVRWVSTRQLQHISSPPSFLGQHSIMMVNIDGKMEPFRLTHTALMEKGIAKVQEKMLSELQTGVGRFASKFAQPAEAAGPQMMTNGATPSNLTINIQLPNTLAAHHSLSWQERLSSQDPSQASMAIN